MNIEEKEEKKSDEKKEDELLKKIEAALFVSARFMSEEELTALTKINPILLKELLQKLQEKYNGSIKIINKGKLWKMDVGQEYGNIMHILASGKSEFTKAEKLTLAIIAYKQPITQATVVKIRGNKAYQYIKHFREVGLIRAKRAGRTFLLELTEEFYNYFGTKEPKNIKI